MGTELIKYEATPRILDWQISTVVRVRQETQRVKTFTLALPNWTPHKAGQHYDVRLTDPDGYQTQRSYSIASGPEQKGEIELTVERLEEGEVSTYLHDILIVGDKVELRGPIGENFVWEVGMGGPLLLIAGGSGIVPLMAMLRHRHAVDSNIPTRILYSSRTYEDIIYRVKLETLQKGQSGLEVFHTLTRGIPENWKGYRRRIDLPMLAEVIKPFGTSLIAYVCGPTSLVEVVANGLVTLEIPPEHVRTERFTPTGK
jgi:ferredoxin-NADP reductase